MIIDFCRHREEIHNPRYWLGKRIIKRFPDGTERKGMAVKILNFENANTMFRVDFQGTKKSFRLIYDILRGDAWLDKEEEEVLLQNP